MRCTCLSSWDACSIYECKNSPHFLLEFASNGNDVAFFYMLSGKALSNVNAILHTGDLLLLRKPVQSTTCITFECLDLKGPNLYYYYYYYYVVLFYFFTDCPQHTQNGTATHFLGPIPPVKKIPMSNRLFFCPWLLVSYLKYSVTSSTVCSTKMCSCAASVVLPGFHRVVHSAHRKAWRLLNK